MTSNTTRMEWHLPFTQPEHRPDLINLGYGYPDPALLPIEAMRRACQSALERFGATTLEYGHNAGPGPLVEWLCKRIAALENGTITPGELMVTAGTSQVLDLLLTLFTRPGDTVLVESPTYYLAIRILRDHPVRLVPASADEDGVRVDMLAEIVRQLKREGTPPRALYTVPTFNNPTGISLSDLRRNKLVELADAEGFLILEDDVYRELAYDGPTPPSLWSLAPPGVVARMGSFSKTLAPGLRLGFLTSSSDVINRIVDCGLLDSGGGVNHFTACCVAALCADGDYEPQVALLRETYRARRDALLAALRRHLPKGCTVVSPSGGFFIWITLPDGMSSTRLLEHARAAGVSYVPGIRFFLDGDGDSDGERHLRVAFTLYPEDQLAEAAQKLGQVIRQFHNT